MRVRRYTGRSLEKIQGLVLDELGDQAVLVNVTRQRRGGILPGTGRDEFEVVAAAEEGAGEAMLSGSALAEMFAGQRDQYLGLRRSIKMLDDKLAAVEDRLGRPPATGGAAPAPGMLGTVHAAWHEPLTRRVGQLAAGAAPGAADWHEALAEMIPTAGGILFRHKPADAPDVYALAGPTGVGKTTTLAKLAARGVLRDGLDVGIVTMDTFRVAAVDQMREYAGLIGAEMAVAFSPEEMHGQLSRFQDKDVVFVDTPGRGQFDDAGIRAIAEILGKIPDATVLLAAPAGIRAADAAALWRHYRILKPAGLIVTKTDEAACCDGLTTLFDKAAIPVLYVTDGQRVPEDIHVAAPALLASMIMPKVKPAVTVNLGVLCDAGKC